MGDNLNFNWLNLQNPVYGGNDALKNVLGYFKVFN